MAKNIKLFILEKNLVKSQLNPSKNTLKHETKSHYSKSSVEGKDDYLIFKTSHS